MEKNRNPRGGSLVSGAKTIISWIEYAKSEVSPNMQGDDVPVKIISPAQAAVEQASTEIERKAHAKRGVKRRRKAKQSRSGSKRRRLKTKTPKKKGNRKIQKKKKSKSIKKKKKTPNHGYL